jgi:hypothetical protein
MQLAVRFLMNGGPDGTVEPSAMPSAMSLRQHRPQHHADLPVVLDSLPKQARDLKVC